MQFFGNWAARSAKHAWSTLVVATLAFAASVWAAATMLAFEAGQEGLVSRDEPFWETIDRFYEVFPQLENTAVVVVDGDTVDDVDQAASAFATRLRAEPELFSSVFLAEEEDFFKTHALLFTDLEELTEIVDRLAKAQPALAAIGQDPNLRGFLGLIGVGVDAMESGADLPPSFAELMDQTADAVTRLGAGERVSLSWAEQMMGSDNSRARRRIIMVQPDEAKLTPKFEKEVIRRIRQIADEPQFSSGNNIEVRVTGRLALAYDEINTAMRGVGVAGTLSSIFLAIILILGLPSWRLILSILVTLIAGLGWSMGFAGVAIGSLNLISATFAVLFVGLGVAHALHVCLRYEEYMKRGLAHFDALRSAAETTGSAVALCAITTAIGFASFVPTRFLGIAELGFIAAAGMGFAFIASFTVLPAVLTILHSEQVKLRDAWLRPRGDLLAPRRRFVVVGAILGLAAIYYVVNSGIHFNFSVMSIRDPNAESVRTLADLQKDKIETDFIIMVLVEDPDDVERMAADLEALPQVSEVRTPNTYVAKDQEDKLLVIEDAVDFLWPALIVTDTPPLTDAERITEVEKFLDRIDNLKSSDQSAQSALYNLAAAFRAIVSEPDAAEKLRRIESHLTDSVLRQLERLGLALEADFYEFEDLPPDLKDRLVSRDGISRLSVFPEEDITDVVALQSFVTAVRDIAPSATGRPVIEEGVGQLVVQSFIQAGIFAFVLITLLLLLVLRSLHDTIFVLIPIILAGLLTVATSNLIGIPFNFANVIAIPLIFGLGVDSAIHLVIRARETHSALEVVQSSTPQAILLSSLTTIGAFASLSLSPHKGVASMGMLLTIGITWSLICTLLVLPALLHLRAERRERKRNAR